MYIYIYVCIHTYLYMYTYVHNMYIYVYIYIYVCYVYVSVCVYTCMLYIHMYLYSNPRTSRGPTCTSGWNDKRPALPNIYCTTTFSWVCGIEDHAAFLSSTVFTQVGIMCILGALGRTRTPREEPPE